MKSFIIAVIFLLSMLAAYSDTDEAKKAAENVTATEETAAAEETTVTETQTAAENGDHIVIQGMKYSTSLTELDLSVYDLTDEDIKDLDKMTDLTYLNLENNKIGDLSPLKNLTYLSYLDLGENQISDIDPLKDLTNLTYLDLGNNQISDISPLKNLTVLTKLDLKFNQISDEDIEELRQALPICDIYY